MVEEEVVPEISTGAGGMKKIIIIAVVAIIALIAAYFVVTKVVLSGNGKGKGKKSEKLKEEARNQSTLDTLVGPFVMIDPIIVNLADKDARKFLKVTLQLELSSGEEKSKGEKGGEKGGEKTGEKGEAEKRMPQIRDSIITVLSTKTSEQMLAPEGKTLLREEIISRINNGVLQSSKVRNIYITDFVVQ